MSWAESLPFFGSTYASGFGLCASLIVAIGAQNAYVLRQGLKRVHVGMVVAICASIDIMLIAAGVAGMGALMTRVPALLVVVKYVGALFVFLYGLRALYSAWKGPGHLDASDQDGAQSAVGMAGTIVALSLLNPHVYLDTVVLLGAVGGRHPWPANLWFALGAMSASLVWFCALGYGARLLRPVFEKDVAWRVLDVLIACVMGWIALMLVSGG
ncbi:LysE/ArgO family amino acid transporter [Mycetohabitans sp. B8]|uniref:LysE/ArgO family amino acid transporter n=1 Tax=Mycetohabitans sp. B8 TaxID=2841845 RepID=UPI001F33EA39|nr:LysE/ArgO family amino acid transporter [Mycetohabitans sp. B8]MCG1043437.1 LysE/ArgO family amino acid transporter [Mycetohabitans sp. B8]